VIVDDALGTDEYSVGLDALGRLRVSPTDVSRFIRLDRCERYLRLRLHERSAGMRFMVDYGVVPQSIPPLLTQSGTLFEEGWKGPWRRASAPSTSRMRSTSLCGVRPSAARVRAQGGG
jgi:hypothetical protein